MPSGARNSMDTKFYSGNKLEAILLPGIRSGRSEKINCQRSCKSALVTSQSQFWKGSTFVRLNFPHRTLNLVVSCN